MSDNMNSNAQAASLFRHDLVDVHSHFLPPWYVEAARSAGCGDNVDGMRRWPAWSLKAHLELMERGGIRRSILSVSSPGVHFGNDTAAIELARDTNDFASAIARAQPEQFGYFAAVPLPLVPESITEARRSLDERGAQGIAVKTNTLGVYLSDPSLGPFWDFLDARRSIVFVHPVAPPNVDGVSFGRPVPMIEFLFDTTRTVVEMAMVGMFSRYPGIRWIIPHLGGALPVVAARVDLFAQMFGGVVPGGPKGARADILRDALRQVWFDAAGSAMPDHLHQLLRLADPGQILYGSDWCFTSSRIVLEQLDALDLGWNGKTVAGLGWRALTSRNAAGLFGSSTGSIDGPAGPPALADGASGPASPPHAG